MKGYQPVVARLLHERRPATVLDAPCGSGWLADQIGFACELDGLDLFGERPGKYRHFLAADLDQGLPDSLGVYEAVACCEGLEHFSNPDLFLRSAHRHLAPGGMLIVTTPNTWYPAARLQYLLRGFFPSFPSLAGKVKRGTHMHLLPWSFPQLHLFLTLAGFRDIRLHEVDEPRPKHLYEWLVGLPQYLYCASRARAAANAEERDYWTQSGSRQSVWGRRLVLSAIRA